MPRLAIDRSTATTVEIDGRELLYFGGCGYLGLAHHPEVVRALSDGLARYGVSSGASRETSGNSCEHDALERELAMWLDCEQVLLMPDGYTANLAIADIRLGALTAHIDELGHPSLFDAARVHSRTAITYPHLDLKEASNLLPLFFEAFVMSDTVFPSRGEIAPMRELATLVKKGGGVLVLDDCHGTGVIGATGRGAFEYAGIHDEHVLLTSTLSKALGCYGGFIAGSGRWIDQIRAHSKIYIGTTPIPPAVAAAARVASRLAFANGELVGRLRANIEHFRSAVDGLFALSAHTELPVFGFALETSERMQSVHDKLRADGILAPYVHYPGGDENGNFRIVVTAAHTFEQIDRLAGALRRRLGEAQ